METPPKTVPASKRDEALEAETLAGGLRSIVPVEELFEDQMHQAGVRFCSELLNALGHPTRLRIANVLRRSPHTVGGISSELNIPQANVSQHLAVLLRAGAVVREPEGSARRYRLRGSGLDKILDLIEQFWYAHREDIVAERAG